VFHRVAGLSDKVRNLLLHFYPGDRMDNREAKMFSSTVKDSRDEKLGECVIKCSLSLHFLFIFFCLLFLFFIDGIKSRTLFLCVYECLNHAKNIHDMDKSSIFVFFEIITKHAFLYIFYH
jgi:hypothetical protein